MIHLMKIIVVNHLSVDKNIIWSQTNILNILHNSGKEYMLKALFTGEETIPNDYYIGLDSRSTLSATQNMASLSEPSGGGYARQAISSSGGFSYNATDRLILSDLLTFACTSGSYSVKNLFLTTEPDDTGYLISSIPLSENRTLSSGETLAVKAGLSLN